MGASAGFTGSPHLVVTPTTSDGEIRNLETWHGILPADDALVATVIVVALRYQVPPGSRSIVSYILVMF